MTDKAKGVFHLSEDRASFPRFGYLTLSYLDLMMQHLICFRKGGNLGSFESQGAEACGLLSNIPLMNGFRATK